jgi:hypothetical protein
MTTVRRSLTAVIADRHSKSIESDETRSINLQVITNTSLRAIVLALPRVELEVHDTFVTEPFFSAARVEIAWRRGTRLMH